MNSITVSAPGKLILFGEHAVVYGKMAISSSLNVRAFVRLTPTDTGDIDVSMPIIEESRKWSLDSLKKLADKFSDNELAQRPTCAVISKLKMFLNVTSDAMTSRELALVVILYLYLAICGKDSNETFPSLKLECSSQLPISAGLGSSASISVCLSAVLLQHQQMITPIPENPTKPYWTLEDLKKIDAWAFRCECIMHGTPSGIDNTVCTFGGAVSFENSEMKPLKRDCKLNVLIVNTKVQRSTKRLVEGVKHKMIKYPDILQHVIESIHEISLKACEALDYDTNQDTLYTTLEELIDMNHCQLVALGVSHLSLENARHILQKFCLKAKLTGAGGGGCAFALLKPNVSRDQIRVVTEKLKDAGFNVFESTLGGPGVKLCGTDDTLPFLKVTDL